MLLNQPNGAKYIASFPSVYRYPDITAAGTYSIPVWASKVIVKATSAATLILSTNGSTTTESGYIDGQELILEFTYDSYSVGGITLGVAPNATGLVLFDERGDINKNNQAFRLRWSAALNLWVVVEKLKLVSIKNGPRNLNRVLGTGYITVDNLGVFGEYVGVGLNTSFRGKGQGHCFGSGNSVINGSGFLVGSGNISKSFGEKYQYAFGEGNVVYSSTSSGIAFGNNLSVYGQGAIAIGTSNGGNYSFGNQSITLSSYNGGDAGGDFSIAINGFTGYGGSNSMLPTPIVIAATGHTLNTTNGFVTITCNSAADANKYFEINSDFANSYVVLVRITDSGTGLVIDVPVNCDLSAAPVGAIVTLNSSLSAAQLLAIFGTNTNTALPITVNLVTCTTIGSSSIAIGAGAHAVQFGQFVVSSGYNVVLGDSQRSLFDLRGAVTGPTWINAYGNNKQSVNSTPGVSQSFILERGKNYSFKFHLVASTTTGFTAKWERHFLVARLADGSIVSSAANPAVDAGSVVGSDKMMGTLAGSTNWTTLASVPFSILFNSTTGAIDVKYLGTAACTLYGQFDVMEVIPS